MTDYTPTTPTVKEHYEYARLHTPGGGVQGEEVGKEFDKWVDSIMETARRTGYRQGFLTGYRQGFSAGQDIEGVEIE